MLPRKIFLSTKALFSIRAELNSNIIYLENPRNGDMKLHCLYDADNGYYLDYTLDSGKSIKKDSNYLHDLIMKVINPYLGKFHILYCDSFYTSPKLFLSEKQTGATGMVNKRLTERIYRS